MSRLKSGIILKDQVFVPDYDSYTDMLKELNIENDEFVCAELSPVDGDIFSDISTWQFNINQDILPDWFVYEHDKKRMIEVVKAWLKDHVFKNVDKLLELEGNDKYYLKNCKNVEAYDNCKIIARGNCTINVHDNCIINAYNSSVVNAFNNSTVYAYNHSIVNAHDDCIVNAYNDCTVYTYDECTVNAQNNCKVYAYNHSIVNAYDECTVYAQNTCTVNAQNNCIVNAFNKCTVNVQNKSEVNAYDNCIVNAYNNCTVNAYHDSIIKSIDCKLYDKNLKLFNNAIFIDKAKKIIYCQNEDYKLIKIGKTGRK